MTYLKKRESSSSAPAASGSCVGSAEERLRWPAFLEFLESLSWPDGTPRTAGTISVFTEAGVVKACLSDRDQGLVCFVTSRSLLDVFDLCEAVLAEGTGDWRVTKGKPGSRK